MTRENDPTRPDPSAPLVDYDTVDDDFAPPATMPENPAAAREVLRRVVDECRTRVVRDGSAPTRRSTRVAPLEPIPPRRPEESRSQASAPCPEGIEGCEILHLPPARVAPVGDMKAGLTSSRPRLSIVPAAGELYQCRAMEYGADKYRRGNYHGAPPQGVSDSARVMGYVDAAIRHLRAVADAYNREFAVAPGPASLTFGAAIATPDNVASGGFPASGLPHLAHAMASVSLAIQCGVDDDLLPEDPGQPWRGGKVTEERSPEAATRLAGSDS